MLKNIAGPDFGLTFPIFNCFVYASYVLDVKRTESYSQFTGPKVIQSRYRNNELLP